MKTENLSTLKIHQMSKAQYNREEEAGRIDNHAIYITPDEEINLTPYATTDYVDRQDYNNSVSIQNLQSQMNNALAGKSNTTHTHDGRYYTEAEVDSKLSGKANTSHTHDTIKSSAGGQVSLYFDDDTNKYHWFKPNINYPTTQEINIGSINTRTWDRIYAGIGIYVNGTACSLEGHTHDDRYYTEAETDKLIAQTELKAQQLVSALDTDTQTKLSSKSDTSHTHTALFHGNYNLYLVAGSTCTIRPNNADVYSYYLGSGTHRFANIYTKNLSNSGSDRNLKENIEVIPQRYVDMLDGIEPVIYKWKNGDRIHAGYISQEVEESMKNNEITAEEFGGFCKDAKLDEEGNPIDGEYIYSLRYGEFIPILHAKVKQLEEKYNAKIEEYDAKIAELDKKLEALTV